MLTSGREKYTSSLKIIHGSESVRVISIDPHIRPMDLAEVREYLHPIMNTEVEKYARGFVSNRKGELLLQYKVLMGLWTKEQNITERVGAYIRSHIPSEYILDITRLNF